MQVISFQDNDFGENRQKWFGFSPFWERFFLTEDTIFYLHNPISISVLANTLSIGRALAKKKIGVTKADASR